MSISKDDKQISTLWSNQAFTVSHADGTGVAHDNMGVTQGFMAVYVLLSCIAILVSKLQRKGLMPPMLSAQSQDVMPNHNGISMTWIFK